LPRYAHIPQHGHKAFQEEMQFNMWMSRAIRKIMLFNPLKTKIEVNFIEKFSPLRTEKKNSFSFTKINQNFAGK
jgi:acetate kinase